VLTALSVAGGGRMPVTVLAAHIGWERSRVSHHVRRMSARGLVRRLFFEGLPDGLVRPLGEANHRDPVMTSHRPGGKPGSVTAGIRSLEMEFAGFEIEDLNARQFVHKHVFGDLNADQGAQQQPACQATPNGTPLPPGERPRLTRTRPDPTGLTVRGKQFGESACRAPRWAGRFPCTIQATTPRRGQ
jgi:MarR family